MKIARITWVDSAGQDGWVRESDREVAPMRCLTVGLLIDETAEHVVVASTVADWGGPHAQVNSPLGIPRCSITSMEAETPDAPGLTLAACLAWFDALYNENPKSIYLTLREDFLARMVAGAKVGTEESDERRQP